MSVDSYLRNLSRDAIVRDHEKESIRRSIVTLQDRLNNYFEDEIKESFIFGSYGRGTILPRTMDQNSDIDYMVVFEDGGYRPQTYLDKLRRFVQTYYTRSEIAQSNPTIALSLNHIRFELVPAIDDWFYGLSIPDKDGGWMETDPTGFNNKLISANKDHENLIKPLVRLVKYWNASNGYIFESYGLEKDIVSHGFGLFGLFIDSDLKSYFYDYMEALDVGESSPKYVMDKIERMRKIIDDIKNAESEEQEDRAERLIRRLLPPINRFEAGLLSY